MEMVLKIYAVLYYIFVLMPVYCYRRTLRPSIFEKPFHLTSASTWERAPVAKPAAGGDTAR